MTERLEALQHWLQHEIHIDIPMDTPKLTLASSDASFRRYFRLHAAHGSYIVMDAPPPQEDCRPFVAVARQLLAAGVCVPDIFASDVARGFLLLTDFGDTVYLEVLNSERVDVLYKAALAMLLRIQQADARLLPLYDAALLQREMALFVDWLLLQHLRLILSDADRAMFAQQFAVLTESALSQPQVFVHRDYHSRNLMYVPQHPDTPGVLDFQDAVRGAITYDLVSLLRDCYIAWPESQVIAWVRDYQEKLQHAGVMAEVDQATFYVGLIGWGCSDI
jgi:N-acetylmuramate 1-kinase